MPWIIPDGRRICKCGMGHVVSIFPNYVYEQSSFFIFAPIGAIFISDDSGWAYRKGAYQSVFIYGFAVLHAAKPRFIKFYDEDFACALRK